MLQNRIIFSLEKKIKFSWQEIIYTFTLFKTRKKNVVAWHLQKGLDARKNLRDKRDRRNISYKQTPWIIFFYIPFTGYSRTSLGKIIL